MYVFLRSYRSCGPRSQTALAWKNYSSAVNRSHFALNYSLQSSALHGPSKCASHLLPKQYYLSAASGDYNADSHNSIFGFYRQPTVRHFHSSLRLYEQPSSKVEVTVQTMKDKQKEKVEEIMKEAATSAKTEETGAGAVATPAAKEVAPPKKPLKTRIWEECLHYYHGFRLLFIDISICFKLLLRILNGKTLSRRENKLLVRTVSDMFRLIPFSVFIIVPFMELLLPFFIKFFPGMLPSTFQTAKEREDKLKQSVQVRLEVVKFLQQTLDEMACQHEDHKSEEAKQFDQFFQKMKNPNEYVSNDEIIKFAKRFDDEYTLDSLSRGQLAALCRVLELNTVGTTNLLRFQLRMKLRSLAADDRVISREGVNSLDLWELQQACKARGMRAYGLTQEKMRKQLQEWIDLSLNEKVPPTLLLLSRTMLISDDIHTTDKLKETIRVLPDSLAAQTKAAIGEREGKIDNKTKIEIMKEEERKIKEEREEEREAKAADVLDAAEAKDKAPIVDTASEPAAADRARLMTDKAELIKPAQPTASADTLQGQEQASGKRKPDEEKSISSKDVELLNQALKTLSTGRKMVVEKETIKDLKEELEEYKEDVEELREVRQVVREPVRESRAARMLFKKVNSMIGKLDEVLLDLEQKQKQQVIEDATCHCKAEDIVKIDDLVQTIKKLRETSDESRLKQIENVLSKLDADKDGAISVDDVLKVVEAIGRENVKLNEHQLEELIALLDKEQVIEAEEKIEKALAKSIKEAEENKKLAEEIQNDMAESTKRCAEEMKDKALDLDEADKKNVFKTELSSQITPPSATQSKKSNSKNKTV